MNRKLRKSRLGVTLIEIMVGLTVIVIGVLGSMMYTYQSALNARNADVQVGAGRVALLILEGWKGAAGSETYNPSTAIPLNSALGGSDDITITSNGSNNYTIQLTGGTPTTYSVQLTFNEDVDGDSDITDDIGIRKLTVEATSGLRTVTLSDFVRN